jgi:hypothetical protein
MPRSSTARFTEKWQKSVGDENYLESIVDRWRNSSSTVAAENMAMFAETMNLAQAGSSEAGQPREGASRPNGTNPAFSIHDAVRPNGAKRREDAAPAARVASPPQATDTLRSIRERLQQR